MKLAVTTLEAVRAFFLIAFVLVLLPAMVACQTEEGIEEASVGPETFSTLTAWGGNSSGQLGDGTFDSRRTTPVEVSNLDGAELKAIAGGSHGLALKDDGTVWTWGMNQDGQLGNGSYTLGTSAVGINTPVQVGELSAVKAIAGGGQHSLAGW